MFVEPGGRESITSISEPLVRLNVLSPTRAVSGWRVRYVPSSDLVRRVWDVEGMPVMGSSLDFRVEMDQVGVMRRSAERRGLVVVDCWEGLEGTVMRRGMSWGVVRDIVVAERLIMDKSMRVV